MTKDRRPGNGVTVVSVGMVEVRSNPHSQGGPRCLGVLGKLANLARGWASGTTGGAPRSQSCVGYIRHVLGKRLLRASHAQMYKCKGSETWYMLPWLHASARAYAHMSCVWDLGSALLRPRLLCGVAYGCLSSEWRHRRGCMRAFFHPGGHPTAERLRIRAKGSEISLAELLRVTST